MKLSIVLLLLLVCQTGFSQEWHKAGKKLKLPKSAGGVYAAIGARDRYDSVSITYTVQGDTATMRKGFKRVYIRHRYYTDKGSTKNAFFTMDWKRADNVERYYFN